MKVEELSGFFRKAGEDNRITTSHISLYIALFELWNQSEFAGPVSIKRTDVMRAAKISGIATFHKCIRDLHELNYIEYNPSYNPAIASTVVLLKL